MKIGNEALQDVIKCFHKEIDYDLYKDHFSIEVISNGVVYKIIWEDVSNEEFRVEALLSGGTVVELSPQQEKILEEGLMSIWEEL